MTGLGLDAQEPDPDAKDFIEVWRSLPASTRAEKIARRMSVYDQRMLMVEAGLFKPQEENANALNLPVAQVRHLATVAVEMVLAGEVQTDVRLPVVREG